MADIIIKSLSISNLLTCIDNYIDLNDRIVLILIHTGSRGRDQRDDAVRRLRDDPLLQLGNSIWKGCLITFLYPYFHLFGFCDFSSLISTLLLDKSLVS